MKIGQMATQKIMQFGRIKIWADCLNKKKENVIKHFEKLVVFSEVVLTTRTLSLFCWKSIRCNTYCKVNMTS